VRSTWIRAVVAALAAIGAAVVLQGMVRRPAVARVWVVTAPVAAGTAIAPGDLAPLAVIAPPPPGALTPRTPVAGLLAQVPLAPGQTLTAADLGRTYLGVPRGRVALTLPVAAAQSALATPGDRVDVLAAAATGKGLGLAVVVAAGVRVLAVASSAGAPLTPGSGTAPGLVTLAVTPGQAAALVPLATASGTAFWLVRDPAGVMTR
jgi:pilus assembly protein CpaB